MTKTAIGLIAFGAGVLFTLVVIAAGYIADNRQR